MLAFGIFYAFTFLDYLIMVENGKKSFLSLRTSARQFSRRHYLLHSHNELVVSEMEKKMGVNDLVSEIMRVENCPDF